MESAFLSILGLPLHPLVVHVAVVAVPLAGVMVLLGVLFYRRYPKLLGLATLLTWVAGVAAFFATQSGEALAEEIGITSTHEQWGELVAPVSFATAIVASVTWFVRARRWRFLSLIGTLVLIVAGPALLVLAYLAGHSGAEATWGNTLSDAKAGAEAAAATVAEQPVEIPGPTVDGESTEETPVDQPESVTLADVSTHNTLEDCWIVVDGVVYDVSGYGDIHPGGDFRIAEVCGTDATEAFRGQHGTGGSPNSTLAGFELAPLTN